MQILSYSSGGQKSKMDLTGLKSRRLQGCIPFRRPLPCLFQLLEAAHTPWLVAPSETANGISLTVLLKSRLSLITAGKDLPMLRTYLVLWAHLDNPG